MNGRYKELAREAGLLTYNPEGAPTKLQKFAELIVLECAEISGGNLGPTDRYHTARRIKEHFGIRQSV